MEENLIVILQSHNEVTAFAAEELKRYLGLMQDNRLNMETKASDGAEKAYRIKLGAFEDFDIKPINGSATAFDDEIFIDIHNCEGIIAGANPRSVLLGVYKFLTESGCRWVRPGAGGEIIPERSIGDISVSLQERPSYRHRGICIEGAVSLENVRDTIAWLPKVGLNSYFIQFREAYTFFERWYNHTCNPQKQGEQFTIEKAEELTKTLETEIGKRGLVYHKVGHGWTCEPLGIPGISWDAIEEKFGPEITRYFAMVKGERKMVDGIPLNLNLCYSNPEVQKMMVRNVLDYLKSNKNVDILHFWLADGFNNQCECENCKIHTPADFYVQILNKLDRVLTENNIETKIVFLLYYDLLWTPEQYHIENPDRFIMMFAPITRTYTQSFVGSTVTENRGRHERNNIKLPKTINENLGFLKSWKKEFSGDSFDFDYHFMWDHFYDPGSIYTAKTVYEDIRNLKGIGLDGLISCQCQRAFLPAGLGVYIMARTLWNDRLDFNEAAADYFSSAFGEQGEQCFSYLLTLSELFTPPYMRGEISTADEQISNKYDSIHKVCEEFGLLIDQNKEKGHASQRISWGYLTFHMKICKRMAELLKYRTLNKFEIVESTWKRLKEYICSIEDEVQPVFDLYEFIQTFEIMNGFVLKNPEVKK